MLNDAANLITILDNTNISCDKKFEDASERVKVTVVVSPAFNEEAADVIAMVGLTVSTDSVEGGNTIRSSAFSLPSESENLDEAHTPWVVALSDLGVNVAV